ncbi:glycosyltransferase family 9 protein [Occallatibacter savannae]|uniref:glycosyltransferase family 9 protein n=1 Tax=Occallatibacter savannae TaxID=1002691 RepID=UPI000D685981|nr:glycosyltransferase family 9 protein [Occallatibacter savannae]
MKKPIRALFRKLLETPALPAGAKLYLDFVKASHRPPRPAEKLASSIFVSFPYNSLGDVLALLPLLERMHAVHPDARIDVAVGSAVASFVQSVPFVHVTPVPAVPHRGFVFWRLRELRELVRCFRDNLSANRYAFSISPRWGSDTYARASRYLMYLVWAERYVSYSARVDGGPALLDCLSTDLAMGGELESESVRQIRLLERVGILSPDVTLASGLDSETKSLVDLAKAQDKSLVESVLRRSCGTAVGGYIVVSPGASRLSNRWPTERYAEVLSYLHRFYGLPAFAVGAPADLSSCEELEAALPGVVSSLGGKTTLHELAAILRGARLFLGNDSGPGHMAGALGIPTIVLTAFALRSDEAHKHSALRWRPNGPKVLQIMPTNPKSPCISGCDADRAHCILEIEPRQVIAAAEAQLTGEHKSDIHRDRSVPC